MLFLSLSMPILAGLGNPGSEYEKTKHNIGFELIDYLCAELGVKLEAKGGPWLLGITRHKGSNLILLKPTTYMNLSGKAISKAMRLHNILPQDCLIITDDLNLPPGKLRIRKQGSDGGHNGLANIRQELGTDAFPRMRIGIGNDFLKGKQADYVLSTFDSDQRKLIDEVIPMAAEAALCFVREGIDTTMNRYNR